MYRTLDLFAGAGGLSLGFEMTGQFKTVAIVENNTNAARTFLKNHEGIKNYEDILSLNFKKMKEELCGGVDVVIGGPPCQGFSNANRQRRQLINGSNELVKKYVEAIKELQPKAFVMENVKTIASDKHHFCLTHEDADYVENELQVKISETSITLYDGDYVTGMRDSLAEVQEDRMSLIPEDELYVLYNLHKKKKSLAKYLSKKDNRKKVESIIEKLISSENQPQWLRGSCLELNKVLENLLVNATVLSEQEDYVIRKFWDIQRYFHGILELQKKDVVYDISYSARHISISLKTYIVIDFIKKAFHKLGYKIEGNVLNAANFGVPQTRERYLLIGVQPKYLDDRQVHTPEALITDIEEFVNVKEAIGDLKNYEPTTNSMDEVLTKYYIPAINSFYRCIVMKPECKKIFNHVCTESSPEALEKFKAIAPGDNFHSLPEELKSSYEDPSRTQNTVYKRLLNEEPSDTVVNVRKSMWIHPEFNRAISAREAARLQAFPDNYVFYGTKDSVYQQIGNAVPPLLGRAIAEQVLSMLGVQDTEYETLKDIYMRFKK
jgi:DNA (cytosine-5)-methyltransferase 1